MSYNSSSAIFTVNPIPLGQVGKRQHTPFTYPSNGFTQSQLGSFDLDIYTNGGIVQLGFTANAGTPTAGYFRGIFGLSAGNSEIEIINLTTGQSVGGFSPGIGGSNFSFVTTFFDPAPAGLQQYRVYRYNDANMDIGDVSFYAFEI